MPAPDLPPPPPTGAIVRPVSVVLHPRLITPEAFRGTIAVVIDNLRASVTIAALLESGSPFVVPCLSVEDARAAAGAIEHSSGRRPLLAGERGGTLIPGFDLDNSPRNHTAARTAGRPVCFTTTNGTAALLHAAAADCVVVGCLANRAAVCGALAADPRPLIILCAGTRDDISLDDCLPAGAMIERFLALGRQPAPDDSSRLCLRAWRHAAAEGPAGILDAMRDTRGGRNLVRLGLDADVEFCSRPDVLGVVPRLMRDGLPDPHRHDAVRLVRT